MKKFNEKQLIRAKSNTEEWSHSMIEALGLKVQKGLSWHKYKTSHIFLCLCLLILSSCLSQPKSNRNQGNIQKNDPYPIPTQSAPGTPTPVPEDISLNYIQFGSQKITSTFIVDSDFQDTFYLRGILINQFLQNEANRQFKGCLVSYFPSTDTGPKVLLLGLTPRYFFNFKNQTREFYFLVQSNDSNINKSTCQSSGIVSTLFPPDPTGPYPIGTEFVYALADVCPECNNGSIGESMQIFGLSGQELRDFNIKNLNITIKAKIGDSGEQFGCTEAKTCIDRGFSCCLEGQCVKDKSIRPNVDTTTIEFLQAQQDVQSNYANILLYPKFYYLCPITGPLEPTPTPTPNSDLLSKMTLEDLKDLYECTTPIQDEQSVCTVKYKDAYEEINSNLPNKTEFATDPDDRNFSTTYMGKDINNIPNHSIYEVIYGGIPLFNIDSGLIDPDFELDNVGLNDSTNDTLTDPQLVRLNKILPSDLEDKTLKIRYKVDGSCKPVNALLARCYKVYTQGQDNGRPSDHDATLSKYLLPLYADLSKSVIVEVDGYIVRQGSEWNIFNTTEKYIEFIDPDPEKRRGMEIFDGQVVKITYFVNTTANPTLVSQNKALNKIDEICECGGLGCSLSPKVEIQRGQEVVIDYSCVYPPPPLPEPPLQQSIYVSSKSTPNRYFDSLGLPYDNPTLASPAQEGNVFEYEKFDYLKPNNLKKDNDGNFIDVGFNEIYGSFSFLPTSARPPITVPVKEGKVYNIYTDQGVFSNCRTCGNDYYSFVNRLFPENFDHQGNGYQPDRVRTSRTPSFTEQTGQFRADDLLFGRACWIPPTMIPWTFRTSSSATTQRKNRLAAQHFLFANGYQRDWYGFDYGALIGSFDGLVWFAVGNERQIKAQSNKLFLAVNSYFADLTDETTFVVGVSEATDNFGEGSNVYYDYQSGAAECQEFHQCESDGDCMTQLGPDYTCQSVTRIKTSWHTFDPNAREIPNIERVYRLNNLFNNRIVGSSKRCVYRGRGAVCTPSLSSLNDETKSYNQVLDYGFHTCSPNNYCQALVDNSQTPYELFNRRISRYGVSPVVQNDYEEILSESDTFGLGARITGRPYDWNGTEATPAETRAQLSRNNVTAICIPGRNTGDTTTTVNEQHTLTPGLFDKGDKVLNLGNTALGNVAQKHYLSSCPTMDDDLNYLHSSGTVIDGNLTLEDDYITRYAGQQNLPTNLLNMFNNQGAGLGIIESISGSILDKQIHIENRCMKAPGARCFTDFDCGPSNFVANQIFNLERGAYTDTDPYDYNPYEYDFWSQSLVCAQKVSQLSQDYELKNNKCCRESGKEITIPTDGMILRDNRDVTGNTVEIETFDIAGIDINLSTRERNSRITPVYKELKDGSFHRLKVPTANKCYDENGVITSAPTDPAACQRTINFSDSNLPTPTDTSSSAAQFFTFSKIAERTCCSGHWIRNFSEENGGGHTWNPKKMQTIDFSSFRCINFIPQTDRGEDYRFKCSNPDDEDCKLRNLFGVDDDLTAWFGTLELTGVPNVLIRAIVDDNNTLPMCRVNYDNEDEPTIDNLPPPHTIVMASLNEEEPPVFPDSEPYKGIPEYYINDKYYFSAGDMRNFDPDIKQVFSKDTVSCCLPAGEQYDFIVDASECCTGYAIEDNGAPRCCLPDYTDVSVYLNRYISSESEDTNLSPSQFDPYTGFLNKNATLAVEKTKQLCCSGQTAQGEAITYLPTPDLNGDNFCPSSGANNPLRFRFLYRDKDPNLPYWNSGVRWNDHIYCVPKGYQSYNPTSNCN